MCSIVLASDGPKLVDNRKGQIISYRKISLEKHMVWNKDTVQLSVMLRHSQICPNWTTERLIITISSHSRRRTSRLKVL